MNKTISIIKIDYFLLFAVSVFFTTLSLLLLLLTDGDTFPNYYEVEFEFFSTCLVSENEKVDMTI